MQDRLPGDAQEVAGFRRPRAAQRKSTVFHGQGSTVPERGKMR